MSGLEDIRRLYADYQEQFRQRERARKPMEGVFGLGTGPRDYPCHDQFVQELEQLLNAIAAQRPDSAQAARMLDYIYLAPLERGREDAVYWMLLAVHSLTLPFIPLLDPQDAHALYDSFCASYSRRKRLPSQEQLLADLRKRAEGK